MYKIRRGVAVLIAVVAVAAWLVINPQSYDTEVIENQGSDQSDVVDENLLAIDVLNKLEIKGRAPKTGYSREQFYSNWPVVDGCSLRQRIIKREMGDTAILSSENNCDVISGEYDEPYTGSHLIFYQKSDFTSGVQIDHVVSLSDAWQKGAQNLTKEERYNIATDPLNLLAVDAATNMKKSDGDAATWLPPNKKFRCAYVARQVSVKYKYKLWVSEAEYGAIAKILENCPNEAAVGISL